MELTINDLKEGIVGHLASALEIKVGGIEIGIIESSPTSIEISIEHGGSEDIKTSPTITKPGKTIHSPDDVKPLSQEEIDKKLAEQKDIRKIIKGEKKSPTVEQMENNVNV